MENWRVTIKTEDGDESSYDLEVPNGTPERIRELALLGLLYDHDWCPGGDEEIEFNRA